MRGRALEVSLSGNGSDISLIAFPVMQVLPARWCSQQQRVKASRPQAREGTCRARPGYSAENKPIKHRTARNLDARESARGFFECQWERYFADCIPGNAGVAGTLLFAATARESQSTAGSRRNL